MPCVAYALLISSGYLRLLAPRKASVEPISLVVPLASLADLLSHTRQTSLPSSSASCVQFSHGHFRFFDPLSLPLLFLLRLPRPIPAQTITFSDVPLYSSLVQCASLVCSVALASIPKCGSTSPLDPYAACACLKDQNSASVSAYLTAVVEGACGNSASEDATSVLTIFHTWCLAIAPSEELKVTATNTAADSEHPRQTTRISHC